MEARDGAGATARRSFSITVDPARPLEITNQGSVLATGAVGQSYATSLFASGGVRPWTWSIIGSLPPGLSLGGNTISGTPTAAGTFSFTARVRSADGQQAERIFTISGSTRIGLHDRRQALTRALLHRPRRRAGSPGPAHQTPCRLCSAPSARPAARRS